MSMPWAKITASMVGVMGLGYVLMKAVTPTPEQLYEKMSPDMRRKVDATRAQRLAGERAMSPQMSAQSDDPDAAKPMWADSARGR